MTAVRDEDPYFVALAHDLVIRIGEAGTEDALIKALNSADAAVDREMVGNFLFCGNAKLAAAAQEWMARDEWYASRRFLPVDRGVRWGDRRGGRMVSAWSRSRGLQFWGPGSQMRGRGVERARCHGRGNEECGYRGRGDWCLRGVC